MNCQNKLVSQLGSVHKIDIHLEATSPSSGQLHAINSQIFIKFFDIDPLHDRQKKNLNIFYDILVTVQILGKYAL